MSQTKKQTFEGMGTIERLKIGVRSEIYGE